MKGIQKAKQNDLKSYGAKLFILMNADIRANIIHILRNNPIELENVLMYLKPRFTGLEIRAVTWYLISDRDAILGNARLQGGTRRRTNMRRLNKTRR